MLGRLAQVGAPLADRGGFWLERDWVGMADAAGAERDVPVGSLSCRAIDLAWSW